MKVGQLNKSSLSEVWVVGVVLLQLRVHLRVRKDVAKIKKLFLREICKIPHFFKKNKNLPASDAVLKAVPSVPIPVLVGVPVQINEKRPIRNIVTPRPLLYTFSPVYGPVVGEAVVVLVGPRPAAVQVGLKKTRIIFNSQKNILTVVFPLNYFIYYKKEKFDQLEFSSIPHLNP